MASKKITVTVTTTHTYTLSLWLKDAGIAVLSPREIAELEAARVGEVEKQSAKDFCFADDIIREAESLR